ncbi:hypothetical protein [Planktothrix agardhii]|jgi:hypothetical protein|uniref:Allophycocyanin beta chain (Modular protein) n=1 Tax=Planktothrix agardhii TaxID=1160 RepID=A0AAD1Q0R0_PLAAG|nr:hypothetical protein [Planktothrix agardhii]MCB8762978.1 hypothetical protein [Planktothrix agardhii 1809]MCB8780997.1 hypothetical protein [Planktothrix agardhii 1808]MCB8785321.1 hypothetical protein [Planktothrix agardhii 1025]MCF3567816.1 hypothetical protein [Planktothrix agardhii 1807]MCF3591149.1 hypothetical protein [Planktothrix agardhii 1029]
MIENIKEIIKQAEDQGTYIDKWAIEKIETDSKIETAYSNNQSEVPQKKGALDDLISIFKEWTKDESGYDQEVYPLVEQALKSNPLSL